MKSILEVVRDLIKPYIDKNANNIAHVEDSPVENPYFVGDQLIYKGVLYNVTADISIGDALEIGTNISVAPKLSNSIKSALNKLKSDGTSSGTDFNFDIQNGVPGWNSATNRGSSTFHPFSAGSTASDISYDNTTSDLNAIDVQTAIDEIDSNTDKKLPTYENGLSSWDTTPTNNSTKPVTSGGVKAQFDAVTNEFTDLNNILGAKNILPNGASTVTTNGITFTVNANGTVKATGTATADASLVLASSFYVGNGRKVILSGCPSGGSTSKYFMYLTNENGNTSKGNDVGSGITVTADADNLGCRILVKSGQALGTSGITFSPMVRPENIRNASYVPFVMTNRDLTTRINDLKGKNYKPADLGVGALSGGWITINKYGDVVTIQFNTGASFSADAKTWVKVHTGTFPAGFRPSMTLTNLSINDSKLTDIGVYTRYYSSGYISVWFPTAVTNNLIIGSATFVVSD